MNQCAMLLSVAVHCTYLTLAGVVTALFVRNGLDSESLNVTFAFVDICTDLFWKNTKFRWPAAIPSASATDRLMAEVRSRAADSAHASALFCSSLRVTYSLPRSSARPTNPIITASARPTMIATAPRWRCRLRRMTFG